MHTNQIVIIYRQRNQTKLLGTNLYYCMRHLMIGLQTFVQQRGLQYYEGFRRYVGFPTMLLLLWIAVILDSNFLPTWLRQQNRVPFYQSTSVS